MAIFDVVIVGAGIVGSAIARESARAGLRTAVIEEKVPGSGITAAGMGHLVVMDDSPAQLALTTFSRELWQQERETLPASIEFESRGTLWVASDEEEMKEVHAKRATYEKAGVASEVLDAKTVAAVEPNLRPGLAGGLRVPEDAVVYPPAAAAHFLSDAQHHGAKLVQGRAAAAGKGEVVLANSAKLQAERIVLAAGADISLLPQLPIQKRKGHLLITDRYPGFAHHQLVELGYLKSAHKLTDESVAFNLQPRQTGQMLIGSSRQFGKVDPAAEPRMLRLMLERAIKYMPKLAALSAIRAWTGFRASTDDKLPLIGPAEAITDDPSLWLAMGFEGLGITNAPGAARLLVDQLLGNHSALDVTPFLPARLAVKKETEHA
ncbi:NAD(P)/FAD-dependent oxidoreductase [Silvibacterium dinghuense]|uniref:FAD-binding oxidoreductase n=1 Tax=Silvibacterium dinghuense TaxID=1560006 RepID=A0A4Q1SI52_9BACT|nr:FAD-dependent oxidoreductase [Silvibacterium dinghuense]RXS97291.1 FAD-binding oxidoreductase [Silvibacterium dinghuense]GGG97828.1 D-amino acid oxidase [Silvibacterium dinghuense]